MTKVETWVNVKVDLKELDIGSYELAQYIMSRASCDFDTNFLNAYLSAKNWRNQEEIEEVALRLSDDTKEVMKKMLAVSSKDDESLAKT